MRPRGSSQGDWQTPAEHIAREMRDSNFDPFRVKLIKPDDPLAQAAIEIRQRFLAKVPTRLRGRNFGGIVPEEVYIYPRPVAVP